jgi:uncharacterized membrane protein YraQ (UPF0718 family)
MKGETVRAGETDLDRRRLNPYPVVRLHSGSDRYTSTMEFVASIWKTMCELSPWLLLGMFLAGLMHVLLPVGFASKNLRGFWGVIKSVAIGVPLPLCSCGVIPAGIGLKRDGASDGSAVAFLISTPQTGVDSVLVSASFFGFPFAIFKVVAAAVMGLLGGWVTDGAGGDDAEASDLSTGLPIVNPTSDSHPSPSRSWRELGSHAVEMLRSIWVWLVVGVLISAVIDQFQLSPLFDQINGAGLFPAMLLVLLFSIPLYVCATASVPIAASLVSAGLPPAVALVFLMAGPATNVATLGAIRSNLGSRALWVYLVVIVVGSLGSAWIFDGLVQISGRPAFAHLHQHDHHAWWSVASAIVVSGLIAWFVFEKVQKWFRQRQIKSGEMMDSVTIGVSGMTCGNCVARLERHLNAVAGVESVIVDLKNEQATVGGADNWEAVRSAVVEAGFTPK